MGGQILAWVLCMTAMTGKLAVGGAIVLAVVLLASLFVERPFCKYGCPYGAVLGIFNLFRLFKIKRNAATCIDCKACDRACPVARTVLLTTGKMD